MSTPILPDIGDPIAAPFWAGAREGRLLVQHCAACATPRFPPRPFCGRCGSAPCDWRPSAGRGRIWSWVLSHGPTLPAFADLAPYPVAVVELDDLPGIRMVGNLIAAPGAAINSVPPEAIAIGLPVSVSFASVADGVVLPMWRPG
jgi:uncharacterized OB-fold protein